MGKSFPNRSTINKFTEAASKAFKVSKPTKSTQPNQRLVGEVKSIKKMESGSLRESIATTTTSSSHNSNSDNIDTNRRVPLSDVVADCVKRWFRDTLKEAKTGDVNMQVLVGQMYCSGYGIPRDAQKGRIWISRASRIRSSVWKVSDKRPGYNASDSDSDSDELQADS